MFDKFAWWNAGSAPAPTDPPLNAIEKLIRLHPHLLLTALEQFYAAHTVGTDIPDYSLPVTPKVVDAPDLNTGISSSPSNAPLDHAIYGFMIENTRIFEIFDKVLREYETGERFETPDPATALWLRSTEALFFRDLPPGYIGALTSTLRPDMRAIRRNVYYRLLGLDLNHGLNGKGGNGYEKPQAANRDFVLAFEALLREVWRGSMNAANAIGPNETDNAAIADQVQRLRDMLRVRRLHGNLRREEFWAVATMSWFHLAVRQDTPIVRALKAEAESPGDRLRKIGERVGVPAHNRADAFFSMAHELSQVITFIETNPDAANVAFASGYYAPAGPWPNMPADMRTIITQWSIATGRDIKAQRVAINPAQAAMLAGRVIQGRTERPIAAINPPG